MGKRCNIRTGIPPDNEDLNSYLLRLQLKWPAKMLFDMVCKHLGLLESDYFGLEYCDSEGGKVKVRWHTCGVICDMQHELRHVLGILWLDLYPVTGHSDSNDRARPWNVECIVLASLQDRKGRGHRNSYRLLLDGNASYAFGALQLSFSMVILDNCSCNSKASELSYIACIHLTRVQMEYFRTIPAGGVGEGAFPLLSAKLLDPKMAIQSLRLNFLSILQKFIWRSLMPPQKVNFSAIWKLKIEKY